jgi:methyl-accepting chemotaxis protein
VKTFVKEKNIDAIVTDAEELSAAKTKRQREDTQAGSVRKLLLKNPFGKYLVEEAAKIVKKEKENGYKPKAKDIISNLSNALESVLSKIEKGELTEKEKNDLGILGKDKRNAANSVQVRFAKEILGSVEISSSSIIDISKATHEQTEFSENIAKSLEEIAEIAKKTAERSKQSIESVTELEFLSKTLNQTVEKFKLAQ